MTAEEAIQEVLQYLKDYEEELEKQELTDNVWKEIFAVNYSQCALLKVIDLTKGGNLDNGIIIFDED